jgi:hypothetical protein
MLPMVLEEPSLGRSESLIFLSVHAQLCGHVTGFGDSIGGTRDIITDLLERVISRGELKTESASVSASAIMHSSTRIPDGIRLHQADARRMRRVNPRLDPLLG